MVFAEGKISADLPAKATLGVAGGELMRPLAGAADTCRHVK